jgi:CheY-like chemotaxis protein
MPASSTVAAVAPSPRPLLAQDRVALVVEDDDQAAALMRLLLEAEGFSVIHAADAESALRLAPQQPLCLITLDVHLPGMDGWEFLSRIRDDTLLAHVPVVIVAGVIDSNLALSGGASAILQKPILRTQLKASLAHLGLHEHGPTQTVLVVDDDPKAVEVIAAFLPAPAYAVVRAYSGAEALTLARRVHPDLILLDLMMPGINGFDVVSALHADPETAGIAILVVTAKHITAADRAALVNGGNAIGIVNKAGFDRHAFMSEVRRALPERVPVDG